MNELQRCMRRSELTVQRAWVVQGSCWGGWASATLSAGRVGVWACLAHSHSRDDVMWTTERAIQQLQLALWTGWLAGWDTLIQTLPRLQIAGLCSFYFYFL
jgi:hypothetical protein